LWFREKKKNDLLIQTAGNLRPLTSIQTAKIDGRFHYGLKNNLIVRIDRVPLI
jgi:hypothetical protein